MTIQRLGQTSPPGPVMSKTVIHNNMVYLAGITAQDLTGDVAAQTREILSTIDARLAEAGTDKYKILTTQIWLSDMENFAALNAVWNDWVDADIPPSRACVSGGLYRPEALVEIVVTAVIEE
tara:strand:- start:249 stop:614 length:366 start_codon:yes stop_codon:yes gene_type:complete